MKNEKIELEYFIDYIGKRIHLLDETFPVFNSLPNVITPDFQKRFIEQECLLIDVLDFEWVLYSRNGLVFTYSAYNLQIISKSEKWLHKPFLSVTEEI